MSRINVDAVDWSALKGKVIIVTGGAAGIGEGTVKLASENGAKVVCADWNDAGKKLEALDNVSFVKTDVSSWDSQVALFDAAVAQHGTLDAVIVNAGIGERGDFWTFGDEATGPDGKCKKPNLVTLDVNLTGVFYTARLALFHFDRLGVKAGRLVFTASAAAVLPAPPLFTYSAAKHGVLGLSRALAMQAEISKTFTSNCVCPWMTDTAMGGDWVLPMWRAEGMPVNEPVGVARALLYPLVEPVNGQSYWVGGHEVIDMEPGFEKAMPEWLTEPMASKVAYGQVFLMDLYRKGVQG